jgi:hypothetical protein
MQLHSPASPSCSYLESRGKKNGWELSRFPGLLSRELSSSPHLSEPHIVEHHIAKRITVFIFFSVTNFLRNATMSEMS